MPSIRKGLSIAALMLVSLGALFVQDTQAVEVRNKLMKSVAARNLLLAQSESAMLPHHYM